MSTPLNPWLSPLLVAVHIGLWNLALPIPDQGWLAWIALVPLILACHNRSVSRAAWLGFLAGWANSVAMYHWMFNIEGFGLSAAILLGTYLSLYWVLFCAALAWLRRVTWLLSVPLLWTGLEILRGHMGFLALPWAFLGHTQHENLALMQNAVWGGEYLLSFVVALGNAAIGVLLLHPRRKPVWLSLVAILLLHLGGYWYLQQPNEGIRMRIAVVQPSILLSERDQRLLRYQRLSRMTREAAQLRPDLVIWPETAVRDLRRDGNLQQDLLALVHELQIPILLGSSEFEKFTTDENKKPAVRAFNAAYFLTPWEQLSRPYNKIFLLPFGEYLPLQDYINWPEWLVPAYFESIPGRERIQFLTAHGVKLAPLICWESAFTGLAAANIMDGARLLVVLTNDNWFGNSAEPLQHNLTAVMRAVENQVPMVIASNTGPSQIIDRHGRVIAQAQSAFKQELVTADVLIPRAVPAPDYWATWRKGFIWLALFGNGILLMLRLRTSG